jgi:hypothetical protein
MRQIRPLVSLLLLLPAAGAAQRADTTVVPRELAQALVAFSGFELLRPEILVGRAPSGIPAKLVPEGARIVGGATFPGSQMNAMGDGIAVVALPLPVDSARAVMRATFLRNGLTPPGRPGEGPGGFAGSFEEDFMLNFYCGENQVASARVLENARAGSLVSISTRRSISNTPCDPRMAQRMRGRPFDDLPIPPLRLPDGARGGATGSSGSDGTRELRAEIESALTARDVVGHYAAQLQQNGWTPGKTISEADIAMTTLRKKDEKGEEYLAALSDVVDGVRHHLTLTVSNRARRSGIAR